MKLSGDRVIDTVFAGAVATASTHDGEVLRFLASKDVASMKSNLYLPAPPA
ncbi:hypothetical protein [Microbacterium sp. Y-01]|uniref:hypothetical protein n=1 Tax=Microbacterium sp. Y-01 TaxID=2048898 RepID=UPI0019D2E677|nr:hypothetical protein [Microbacterium sp. Y-01]